MDVSRSTIKIFLSRAGNAAIYFGGITLFARWLPPDQLGIYFLYLALLGLLSIPADVGMRGALEKRLSEGTLPERTLGSALAFKVVTISVVAAVLFGGSGYLDRYLGAELALYVIVGLAVREFSRFYVQAVRGELRVGETAPIEIARSVVWISLGSVLLTLGFDVRGLVIAHIVGQGVALAWALLRSDTVLGRPSLERVRSLVAYSKYHTVTAAGGRVYQWMDVAIIGYFLLPGDVSAYELAWEVTLLVLLVSKSLELNLFPQFSRLDANSSHERIGSMVTTALGYAFFLSVPAVVGVAIYSREILQYVFGPEYVAASLVLVILMVEKLFQSFNDIVGSSVRAVDRPDLAAKATVASVTLNLLLSPVLVVTVGIVGAAIATTLSWLLNAVLHGRYLARFVPYRLPTKLLGWYALSSLLMGAVLLAVRQAVPVTGVVTLLAQVGLGVLVYLGMLVVVPDVRARILRPGLRALS